MNSTSQQLAKHLREVFFGGNWTWSNMRDQLSDVDLQKATSKYQSLNTIIALTNHIGYYVSAQLRVFEGNELNASDDVSFDHPKLNNEQEWIEFKQKMYDEVEKLSALIAQFDETKWNDDFTDKKYGSNYRNVLGLIEHTHYHLGQIAIIKKLR